MDATEQSKRLSVIVDPLRPAQGLRTFNRALRDRWPVTEEIRREVLEAALAVLRNTAATTKDRIAAIRAIATMDAVNVTRERNDTLSDSTDQQTAAQVIRTMLQSRNASQTLPDADTAAISPQTFPTPAEQQIDRPAQS